MGYDLGLVALQGPKWFFGIDSVFELAGTIILFMVFLMSYKSYKLVNMQRYKYYSIAFFGLTLGHLSRTIANFAIHQQWFGISTLAKVFLAGYGLHIGLTLAALVLLIAWAFEIKEKKIFCVLLLLVLAMIFVSSSYYLAFYWSAFVMFAFVTWFFFKNARKKKAMASKLVALAFLLLTITQALFFGTTTLPELYMGAHITQILGFLVLFIALVKVQRK
ncbi:hypothetical protein JW851_03675 [Candidatus Woesearchaeota archaeon]|nr:hypothetical protein [Candidatus Woesearchaeota archaeon]